MAKLPPVTAVARDQLVGLLADGLRSASRGEALRRSDAASTADRLADFLEAANLMVMEHAMAPEERCWCGRFTFEPW